MRERAKNVALFLAVLLLADVTAAQVYARLARGRRPPVLEPYRVPSPAYHHDLAPNLDVLAQWGPIQYPLRTNNLGFRDSLAREIPLRSGRTRLVILGDSFAEGVGVAYEETFSGILARDLAPQGVEVLNAAVASYSPAIYYQKTQYLVERLGLQVDAILVLLDVSDVMDEAWLARDGRARVNLDDPEPLLDRLKWALVEKSVVVRVVWLVANHRFRENDQERLALDADEASWDYDPAIYREWGELGLRAAAVNMDRLVALAGRHRIRVAIVVYPWPDQIFRGRRGSRQVTFWRAWAQRHQVPFIDLFPFFINDEDPEAVIREHFIAYDFHWNAAGHRRVAEALLESGLGAFSACLRSAANAERPGIADSCP